MVETGYFLIADILGFGKIVQNLVGTELEARIESWVSLIETTAANAGIQRYQLISDTLFVATGDSEAELGRLIGFSRNLLREGIERSLPLRGAIQHGEFVWGKLTYGRAVIAAHNLEVSQNWIGISCAPNLPRTDTHWSLEELICYPAPRKHDAIILSPVVSWDVPSPDQLFKLMSKGGLSPKGDVWTWDLGEKVNNTILFKLYQDVLRAKGASPRQFHGLLPAHPVSAALTDLLA